MKKALMVSLLSVAAAVLAPVATAADIDTARTMMAPALSDLGMMTRSAIILQGTEDVGGVTTTVDARIAVLRQLQSDGTIRTYTEISTLKNGVEVQRIVGDGYRMWAFDTARNQYSVYRYDIETGAQGRNPEGAAANLFKAAKRLTNQGVNMLLQTMVEAEHARNNVTSFYTRWNPWAPTATVTLNGTGFRALLASPKYVDLNYDISNPNPGVYLLLGFNGYAEEREGSNVKAIQWQATVVRDAYPPSVDLTFAPPAGAKPVSINLAYGG